MRRCPMRVPQPVRLLLTLAVAVQLALAPGLAAADPADSLPFRDPRLPLETRISDLMSRLTLDERIAFLHQYQPEIPRLGIKLFKNGTEALHGLAWSNNVDAGGAQTF